MRTLINRVLSSARKYTVTDYAFLKLTLVSCGVLLGVYFAKFLSSYTPLLWVIFIGSYLWIMYRTFFKHLK